MKTIFQHIKGDRAIWAIVSFLAILSFMPVYSASTNLVYVVGNGSTFGHLIKHAVLLIMGFAIIYGVHKVPYRYFSGGSVIMLPVVIILLGVTLAQGTTIGGANASRWIRIGGIGFQTSTLAGLVLMVYVARYLAKNKEKEMMHIFHDPRCSDYGSAARPEQPARTIRTSAHLREAHPDWSWQVAPAASEADLRLAHREADLDRLQLPEDFDADTPYCDGIYDHARRAVGSAIAAAKRAAAVR